MFKYILQRIGYGHQLKEIESQTEPKITYVPLHSVIPNYRLLEYVASIRGGVDIHSPVIDVLPFTPLEYIVKGFERLISGCKINGGVGNIDKTNKFLNKRLVNIPHYHMSDLEFINVIQSALFDLSKADNFIPYILLSHDDVLLNSSTSFNFAKTAVRLSVPLEVVQTISELKLVCDISTKTNNTFYFSLTFVKEADGWFFKHITSINPLTLCTPFELFMYAWETILIDIDHICNRTPVRYSNTFIDYTHHYNMRTKYDIGHVLLSIAKLIDLEIEFRDDKFTQVQTYITDYNLTLSSHISDFKTALLALKDTGSELEINV